MGSTGGRYITNLRMGEGDSSPEKKKPSWAGLAGRRPKGLGVDRAGPLRGCLDWAGSGPRRGGAEQPTRGGEALAGSPCSLDQEATAALARLGTGGSCCTGEVKATGGGGGGRIWPDLAGSDSRRGEAARRRGSRLVGGRQQGGEARYDEEAKHRWGDRPAALGRWPKGGGDRWPVACGEVRRRAGRDLGKIGRAHV